MNITLESGKNYKVVKQGGIEYVFRFIGGASPMIEYNGELYSLELFVDPFLAIKEA